MRYSTSLAATVAHQWQASPGMTKLNIIVPGPEHESDPDATALWDQTGNFIGTALARMERGRAFSIILGRLQRELCQAYGADKARKVLQAIMNTLE
jgi:hypothetical protein